MRFIREEKIEALCSKKEYVFEFLALGVLGDLYLNQAFKGDFSNTKEKVVLLPTCMRIKSSQDCQAKGLALDLKCQHCSEECNISKITQVGIKKGFEVVMIAHSSDFSQYLKRWEGQKEVGLIGVACLLNLILGGYEMKALDIAAQCVLLDFCGCKNHWDNQGIPTNLNINKLKEIIS